MTKYSVDLSGIEPGDELHERLAQVFAFPGYYGRNWDAFDECIADLAPPVSILVTGFESLRFALPREAKLFAKCLRGAADEAAPGEFKFSGVPWTGH
jgi:RNAse (barnase) inhibitor barstar